VHRVHEQASHSALRCMVDTKTGHGDELAGVAPFGHFGRRVFAVTEGMGRGRWGILAVG
jgi:hypothetical protein